MREEKNSSDIFRRMRQSQRRRVENKEKEMTECGTLRRKQSSQTLTFISHDQLSQFYNEKKKVCERSS